MTSRRPDLSREAVAERRRVVRRLTLQGATRAEIATELGIHPGAVSRIRRELGIQIPQRGPYPPEVFARAEAMIIDGASLAEAARTLGVGLWAIWNRFRGRGWTHQERTDYVRALAIWHPDYAHMQHPDRNKAQRKRESTMITTTQTRTLTNAGRRELSRGNLAMALRMPAATPMPELLDRVRDLVAEREAFDLGRLQADLTAHVDQATGLAYFLAEQLGEHVDDQGDETQIQTVKRLLEKVRAEAS